MRPPPPFSPHWPPNPPLPPHPITPSNPLLAKCPKKTKAPLYAETALHLTSLQATILLAAMNATGLPGLLLPSLLSGSCLGPLNTLIPNVLLTALLAFLLLACENYTALMLGACVFGFFTGGVQSLYKTVVESFVLQREILGVRTAMALAVIGLACLMGPPLGGLLVGGRAGWKGLMGFSGVALVVGGSLLVVARWWRVGWRDGRV